jgi:glycosyltransferase involved in cell wall biosynthesis
MTLSFVIPAYNESATISRAIDQCWLAVAQYQSISQTGVEVIVVDDGSTDSTAEVARKNGTAVVISHCLNFGTGAAFWTGVMASRMDAVCLVPADLENDAGHLLHHHYDLKSVGCVVFYPGNPNVRAFSRRLLSGIYHLIIRGLFGLPYPYFNGPIVIRRSLLSDAPRYRSAFFMTAILVHLHRHGVQCRLAANTLRPSPGTRFPGPGRFAAVIRDCFNLLLSP